MAKKKAGRPRAAEPHVAFSVRIPVKLNAALEAAMKRSRRLKNVEVQVALEKHLRELGLWPDADDEEKLD